MKMGHVGMRQESRIEMRREADVIGRARGATVLSCHRAAELDRAGRGGADTPGQTKQKKESSPDTKEREPSEPGCLVRWYLELIPS